MFKLLHLYVHSSASTHLSIEDAEGGATPQVFALLAISFAVQSALLAMWLSTRLYSASESLNIATLNKVILGLIAKGTRMAQRFVGRRWYRAMSVPCGY